MSDISDTSTSDIKGRHEIDHLLEIMTALRHPKTGCPWDAQQDFRSIAPYVIEEAYEVLDAIERENVEDLKDELGDLLLQIVFHAQMAKEAKLFDFADIVAAICAKMIRRHPHVFADMEVDDVAANWEAIKQAEKDEKDGKDRERGLLDDVPRPLPALARAVKLQKRAAQVGFDWAAAEPIWDKLAEELAELKTAIASKQTDHIEDELGDVFFTIANLARFLRLDPETATRRANEKFTRRFAQMEARATIKGVSLSDMTLAELEALWAAAKADEQAD